MTGNLLVFLGAALASAVEMVEALTIVLALGVTRGWRAPLQGAAAALVVLAVLVAALGPALEAIPIDVLRLDRRLAAARLRAPVAAQGDSPRERAQGAPRRGCGVRGRGGGRARRPAGRRAAATATAFVISFKSTLLEGLEVAFIVITLGANQGATAVAAAGAVVALVVVVVIGVVVRQPLSRVPENTLKFAVGVMLTSFGTFWAGEGVGIDWPGDEASLAGADRSHRRLVARSSPAARAARRRS